MGSGLVQFLRGELALSAIIALRDSSCMMVSEAMEPVALPARPAVDDVGVGGEEQAGGR